MNLILQGDEFTCLDEIGIDRRFHFPHPVFPECDGEDGLLTPLKSDFEIRIHDLSFVELKWWRRAPDFSGARVVLSGFDVGVEADDDLLTTDLGGRGLIAARACDDQRFPRFARAEGSLNIGFDDELITFDCNFHDMPFIFGFVRSIIKIMIHDLLIASAPAETDAR